MRAAPLTEPANKTEAAATKEMMRVGKNMIIRRFGSGLVV